MDVALDANAILNDPRMQGNAFHSLLDYLKKTNSKLVLSKIVLDEVIARYPERLRSAIHKASGTVATLSSLVLGAKIGLPTIDIGRETLRLKQKLLKPSRYVKSQILNNFADIRVEEVAKRGIERVPPANAKGEELRDVIHWLMLLAHARASKRDIAFITEDKHFRNEAALHPRLKKDIQDNGVDLHFYVSLDEFIKANAPAPHELAEADAFGYYGKSHVMDRFEIEARKVFPTRWPTASSIEIIQRDVRLVRGALYDVGPNSQFGELEFSGEVKVRVTTEVLAISSTFPGNYFLPNQPANNPYLVPMKSLAEPILVGNAFRGIESFPVSQFYGTADASTFGTTFAAGKASLSDFSFKTTPNAPAGSTEDTSEFQVTGGMVITLRVVSGKVVNIETEKFELGNIEKIG
ncbi:MAG TPA: PIN domain-containing protein [Terriglobales bacterium]|jgi:hypothetical protein|nr:PIN domain-containing protein [Terriglobales bacterium]